MHKSAHKVYKPCTTEVHGTVPELGNKATVHTVVMLIDHNDVKHTNQLGIHFT